MNECVKVFGERIRILRSEKGLALRDFEILGISKSALSDYENFKKEPALSVVKKLADYFQPDCTCYNQYQVVLQILSESSYSFSSGSLLAGFLP